MFFYRFVSFSLLTLICVSAVLLFSLTHRVEGDANYTFQQPYTKYYFCEDGTLLYTRSGVTTNTAEVS